jgi:hypothetical protein
MPACCRRCGRPLPNTTDGERCEDCHAASRYLGPVLPPTAADNRAKLLPGHPATDRRRVPPTGVDPEEDA